MSAPSRRSEARRTSGLRGAAWEKKWKDLEADLQDAVLKLPEGVPAMQSADMAEEAEELPALQSLTRFVDAEFSMVRRAQARATPREQTRSVEAPPSDDNSFEDASVSESTAHSESSASSKASSGSTILQAEKPSPRVEQVEPEVIGKQSSGACADPEADLPALIADKIATVKVHISSTWSEGDDQLSSQYSTISIKSNSSISVKDAIRVTDGIGKTEVTDLRLVRQLWRILVLLSLLELLLISGGLVADYYWSPCREKLKTCQHLHEMDCWGWSCQEFAPVWASAWPAAGLLFLALPLRHLGTCRPKATPVTLLAVLAVLGIGAVVLVESATAAFHYAARCPMRRESSRCTADLCPSPPCRRESDFSPCLCGLLGEAELARALFLHGSSACQPYEWYTWQMRLLEELVLQYETFACVAGPLTCTATAIGGALLLIQLACCPLLLVGQWGGHDAIRVLLGHLDLDDASLARIQEISSKDSKDPRLLRLASTNSAKGLLSPSVSDAGVDVEVIGKQSDLSFEGPSVSQRQTWNGDVSPEC
ncbi:unnamed protein product [Effrenium voratum]|nr:unnamed protein product [Effrenium voratum]